MDSIMEENLKTFAKGFMRQQEEYANSLNKNVDLERRVMTMQDVIDYNEDVVENAIKIWYEKSAKKAMEYLEYNYIIGDEVQYEMMEKCADED